MSDALADILQEQLTPLSWEKRLVALCDYAKNDAIAFSTSFSLEDQIITHAIAKHKLPVRIFTIDTGRLFEQTHDTFQKTLDAYETIDIETFYPDTKSLQELIKKQGINGFYQSVEKRHACCHVRKVEPLERALKGVDIWISGLRREQSPHRGTLPVAESDTGRGLVKCYPLVDLSANTVRTYIDEHFIPYNPLHDQGYPSIGCTPCTRAISPEEHPRAGRWWWEQEGEQECGLHLQNNKLVRVEKQQAHA